MLGIELILRQIVLFVKSFGGKKIQKQGLRFWAKARRKNGRKREPENRGREGREGLLRRGKFYVIIW